MKRETLFLKAAVFLMGTPVLALGIFGLYWLATHPANPDYAHMLYPLVIGIYVSTIPFYIALYKAFMLLSYIDKNQAFSALAVTALKHIKVCALTFSGVYMVMMPFVFLVAEQDDAPGLVIMGMVPVFASLVIAVFAAVLQKLLQNAIDIKSENDLTV
ncbi:DUF2975 domain-containing protein [Ectobacillus sp. JY-23]|uniref:DUF2975 domain-containing protein n=1 Tax=Ectobacillus sp. JY-23 TaxID=2933872 RepID=UPI001FF51E02|nr:DUF2975 domain-containing protein [Ectobacillus sp. JY-23]UOY92434.1 DUF2975 domain-containing protein [Ectobacillus sp. JY-23]